MLNYSFPGIGGVETGHGSPHGECFRLVYLTDDHTTEGSEDIIQHGVPGWNWDEPVWDDDYHQGVFPPAAPIAAANALEAYVLANDNYPLTSHMLGNDRPRGICTYSAGGVAAFNNVKNVNREEPAGINVHHFPANTFRWIPTVAQRLRFYLLKTRGICHALIDADEGENVAVGDHLEMGLEGTHDPWTLILDADDQNQGTFVSLEVVTAVSTTGYVAIINVMY